MTDGSSLRFAATGFVVFACLLLAGAKGTAQDFLPWTNSGEGYEVSAVTTEAQRYDFFPAALSCPVTRGMDTVGGRFVENNSIVTYPFQPYLVCNGFDGLEFPPTISCDAYCPIPRSETRVPSSLEKLEVQLRDESQNNNRAVTVSVCAQNHVGEISCASVTKSPPASSSSSHQVVTISGSDLDAIRELSDAHTLYLHLHQFSAFGTQPMDFVNWAVYWGEN